MTTFCRQRQHIFAWRAFLWRVVLRLIPWPGVDGASHCSRSAHAAALRLVVGTILATGCSTTTNEEHRQAAPDRQGEPLPALPSVGSLVNHTSRLLRQVETVFAPAVVKPVVLDFVLDASPGSPGGEKQVVRPSVIAIATVLAGMPGSLVRFWAVGDDASATRIIATVAITASRVPGRSAAQAHQAKERAAIIAAFDGVAMSVPKRSPLFSSIVRVTQETTPSGTRHVILLASDLLEHADLGDTECDDLSLAHWQARLRAARLFLPGTMQGITVIAFQTGLRPVANQRCTASIAHHDRVLQLWTTMVAAAGATFTAITGDVTEHDAQDFLIPTKENN